jgi:hypothetical protein
VERRLAILRSTEAEDRAVVEAVEEAAVIMTDEGRISLPSHPGVKVRDDDDDDDDDDDGHDHTNHHQGEDRAVVEAVEAAVKKVFTMMS